jgi:uncharacterized protein YkwD
MMANRIILPVCAESAGGCTVEPPSGDDCGAKAEVDEERKVISLYLPNPPAVKAKGRIHISLPGTEYNPYQCMDAEECLSITRPVFSYHPVSGEPSEMADYPLVSVGKPAHCHWAATDISTHKNEQDSALFAQVAAGKNSSSITVTPGESYTPECDGFRDFSDFIVPDNSMMVPGILVRATHYFTSVSQTKAYLCGQKYYRTCSMTGGIITKVNGEYGNIGISYRVMTENREITAVSSDFVNYEVGDWVFLMSKADVCDLTCDTNYDYNHEPDDAEDEADEGSGSFTDFVKLLNAFRNENGRSPVTMNGKLTTAADRHCKDMTRNSFFAHKGSDGTFVQDRVKDTGYAKDGDEWGCGENIYSGSGTAAGAFNAWKNSPGHRANMLNGLFKETGLARMQTGSSYVWVNVFGYKGAAASEPPETLPPVTAEFVIIPIKIGREGA